MVLAITETPEEKKKREEAEAKLKAGEQKQAMKESGTTTEAIKTRADTASMAEAKRTSGAKVVEVGAKLQAAERMSEPESYIDSEPNFGIPTKIKAKARLKNMTPMERDEFKKKLYGEKDLAKRSALLAGLAN